MLNTLIAIGLMYSGFILFALSYFLRTNSWNGFIILQKLFAAAASMLLLAILLVNVPDISDSLKLITGLDVSIENSKVGFITIGFAFSGVVSSKLNSKVKPKDDE